MRTFAEAAVGEAFWYANANGLVEVAVNQGHAAALLGLALGTPVELCSQAAGPAPGPSR
jgi:S-adenosylmethionine hydrolase